MKRFIVAMVMSSFFNITFAADVVGERYINQLTRGGMISIKQAAESIYNTGLKDTEVLDVAAEVLLQRYPNASKGDIDTLAWLCKALGQSGNSRYYSALYEVAESDAHRKLRKYADNAADDVGKSKDQQYAKGMVDLDGLRDSSQTATAKTSVAAKVSSSSAKQSLDVITEGMSMQEVYDLVGQPTATTTHQTGKAWIPFNYGKKDLARTILLYKGQGRVICSHDGYSSTSRVLEVLIDSNETGYP
ncbi:hypothetical protein [Paraglaciecola hydrolytica]|uniref:Lipoprotein SmpA/OmlA domain-containing protein n=1 Tax=Paraglaciecola hydrolytica TaxID=1799789 RepID=A0A136A2C1_9ALTE|nr:hypothetical protein [Paraglaciecola hydrolytica]KXI29353.1 hypothetical protein AX660_14525 [Paraglaciecola hydrolytica]